MGQPLSWSLVSDAEMTTPQNIIFFNVKIIIYQYGSVGSDAEMVHSALFNFYCESNCILFLESCVGCGNGPLRKI